MPTAPEILPTLTMSRARSTRSRSRCSSAYQSASLTPSVIGSACTPWVRPIIGVRRCSSARCATASSSPASPSRSGRRPARIWIACAVSSTSDEVRPKCSQRAAGPTCSATAVVNAMTSCCVTCSISSMRAMSKRARARSSRAASAGIDAGFGHRVRRRELDLEPGLVAPLVTPDGAHFGVRISGISSPAVLIAINSGRARRAAVPAPTVRRPSPRATRSRTDRTRPAGCPRP